MARRDAEARIEVHVCGVGGLNPLPLPALYDLFERVARSGAGVALINLYRDDFDYPFRLYDMRLESLAARHGRQLLDLGARLARDEGRTFCRGLLRDTVPTDKEGAQFQAGQVWQFVRAGARAQAIFAATDRRRIGRGRKPHAGRAGRRGNPRPFSFLSGPRSGVVEIFLHGSDAPVSVEADDQFCFVTRYDFARIGPAPGCAAVTITQTEAAPTARLLKGEHDPSPREGLLVGFHY